MPKQIRYSIKQKLLGAHNEIVKAGSKLEEIKSLYESEHPDISATINYLVDALKGIATAVDGISNGI